MTGVLIDADLCLIKANRSYLGIGNAERRYYNLLTLFGKTDLMVADLESHLLE